MTAKWSRATTFAAVAGELIEKAERENRAPATIIKMRWALDLLKRDIGNRPIDEIAVPEILATLQRLERQGKLESAKRVRAFAGRVFRYAIATARAKSDPTTHLKGAIAAPKPKPRAAIVDPERLGELLRAIERYSGAPVTVLALSLLPHVFLRPGELRKAQWHEFDFEKKIWTVPAARMKMRKDHKVPLSRQSIFILDQLRTLTGGGQFVFPAQGKAGGTLSENTINAALRRMGFAGDEMCGHGFRATASTNMNEAGTWHPDAIERSQARVDANTVRSVYNRAEHWNERVQLAQWWSDKLDEWRGHPTSLMPVRSSVRALSG